MEQLLRKLRNVGALVCAGVVFIILVMNIGSFCRDVFMHVSRSMLFETIRTIWWFNLAAAIVSGLGNLLYVAENERKADVLAFCGISGIFSFVIIGFLYIFIGVAIGEIWRSVLMFFVTGYACIFVFYGTSHFVHILRNIVPERGEDEELIAF